MAVGADGLMIEVHNDPAKAKSDQFDDLMATIRPESVSLVVGEKKQNNETSLSHIGEADTGEADHQTDHDPDQRNNQAGNLGALAPAGIAVLVSWLGRPLGRLGARCAFGPVAGVIRRQRDRTGFLPRLNVGGAVGILGMVQSIAVLGGKIIPQSSQRWLVRWPPQMEQRIKQPSCSVLVLHKNDNSFGQYRIILSADTASEVRQLLSQKRR